MRAHLSLPRLKHEGRLHAHGRPLSGPALAPEQAHIPGFGATYRDAELEVERAFYVTRRVRAGK